MNSNSQQSSVNQTSLSVPEETQLQCAQVLFENAQTRRQTAENELTAVRARWLSAITDAARLHVEIAKLSGRLQAKTTEAALLREQLDSKIRDSNHLKNYLNTERNSAVQLRKTVFQKDLEIAELNKQLESYRATNKSKLFSGTWGISRLFSPSSSSSCQVTLPIESSRSDRLSASLLTTDIRSETVSTSVSLIRQTNDTGLRRRNDQNKSDKQ